MSLDLQPDEPKLPENDSSPASPPAREGSFALGAIGGFFAAPFLIALVVSIDAQIRQPVISILSAAGLLMMLFFRSTRAFALGAILFVGVAFLVLLAICGNSSF